MAKRSSAQSRRDNAAKEPVVGNFGDPANTNLQSTLGFRYNFADEKWQWIMLAQCGNTVDRVTIDVDEMDGTPEPQGVCEGLGHLKWLVKYKE
jgi:hypothetical protein